MAPQRTWVRNVTCHDYLVIQLSYTDQHLEASYEHLGVATSSLLLSNKRSRQHIHVLRRTRGDVEALKTDTNVYYLLSSLQLS